MLFTQPIFLFLFLPLVWTLHSAAPRRFRNVVLLAASCLFYAWGEKGYVLVLFASILLNYSIGRAIAAREGPRERWLLLGIGITGNLLLLSVFKYPSFLFLNLNRALELFQFQRLRVPYPHVPLGLSFFSLMGMSYLFDLYREQFVAERRLGRLSLYLMLFPYVAAGPIVRYADIARDLSERHLRLEQMATGIRRFIIGLGKKMLIANTLALTVDSVFTMPAAHLSPQMAWLGIVSYTLQLYFDISGYADMAIGLGLMLGFKFPENFNYPFIAQSMTDFWKRWHITLVSWFRDYLFFPLSYRRPVWRIHLNLLIVFLLCGLWHEGSWRFIAWGLAHGSLLAIERSGFGRQLLKWPRALRHLYVLLALLATSVFVRSPSFPEAVRYLGRMIGIGAWSAATNASAYMTREWFAAFVIGLIGCLPLMPLIHRWQAQFNERFDNWGGRLVNIFFGSVRLATLALIFLASAALSAAGTYRAFIYFQY
ncbi:MAG TPA: MBOAT family O-acyltransferase [Pyrinomonadaceae bacterium]|nr:MBOAT family O-acyltransferase [Pyrinomonadaceae bacterium]